MAKNTKKNAAPETAETMAQKQREISVSEFFLKNRHLLGFDSPRKALMTCVKEAVDNSLDACEEAGILPEISIDIEQTADDRFRVSITDNGPGIMKTQIPKIFAKLLYGSKSSPKSPSDRKTGVSAPFRRVFRLLYAWIAYCSQILDLSSGSPARAVCNAATESTRTTKL